MIEIIDELKKREINKAEKASAFANVLATLRRWTMGFRYEIASSFSLKGFPGFVLWLGALGSLLIFRSFYMLRCQLG